MFHLLIKQNLIVPYIQVILIYKQSTSIATY